MHKQAPHRHKKGWGEQWVPYLNHNNAAKTKKRQWIRGCFRREVISQYAQARGKFCWKINRAIVPINSNLFDKCD